jgi:hypothetical protein
MLTLESKFSDYIKVLTGAGACESVMEFHNAMIKKNPFLTVGDAYKIFFDDSSFKETWVEWALKLVGKELDTEIRKIAINKIQSPVTAKKLLSNCDFFTTEEKSLLSTLAESQTEIQKLVDSITEPMEAARLLIDFPHLTDTQELTLKAKFEGRLPTVEKELLTGTVVTAKSQVVK